MKISIIRTNTVRASWMCIALVAGLCLATSSKATIPASDLPDFDNLGNFTVLGNSYNFHNVTVNGNVGVSSGGSMSIAGASTVNGNAFQAAGASLSGANRVFGTVFTGQDLSLEQATVFSASSALAGLTPDQSFAANPTTSLSIDVPAGQVYVLNLNGGLSLSGGRTITLTGDGFLVINVSGSLSLGSGTGIFGNATNIFLNYTGTSNFSTSGGSGGPVINAQFFSPNAGGTTSGGVINGSVFSGNSQITFMSATTINAVPVPEPGTMALAAMGGISMILLRRRLGLKS